MKKIYGLIEFIDILFSMISFSYSESNELLIFQDEKGKKSYKQSSITSLFFNRKLHFTTDGKFIRGDTKL